MSLLMFIVHYSCADDLPYPWYPANIYENILKQPVVVMERINTQYKHQAYCYLSNTTYIYCHNSVSGRL